MTRGDRMYTMSIDEVRRRLAYDPLTGIFTWKIRVSPRGGPGDIAGHDREGYIVVGLDYVYFLGHRLAWAMSYGYWPEELVDHKNRITTDNRLSNLRLATNGQNQWNQRRRKKTGLKGAHWCKKRLMWHSKIGYQKKHYNLGYFDTEQEAHDAYCAAAIRLHGEFARFE